MRYLPLACLSLIFALPATSYSADNINGELIIKKPINTNMTTPSWHKYTRPKNIPSVATNHLDQQPMNYQPPKRQNPANTNKPKKNLTVSVSSGYRQDEFDWNIAGDNSGNNPNVLSELTWRDIQFYEFRGKVEYTVPRGAFRGLYLDGAAYYAEGISGENQDSDWLFDNRQGEFSRSVNDSDNAESKGVSLSIGYELDAGTLFHPYDKKRISTFIPLAGYARQELNLLNTDGNQIIPASGPFAGLNSSYDSIWSGPFLGFKLGSKLQKHRIGLHTEVHFVDYDAEANWNLRADFKHPKSFEQIGDGTGVKLKVDYGYQVTDNIELFANAAIQSWNIKNGRDTTFFANDTVSTTKLNEVNWDSQAYHIGISYLW